MAVIANHEGLVVGRGELYFDRHVAGVGEGERYIGNTPSFQITRTLTYRERKTSYGGRTHNIPGSLVSEAMSLRMTTDSLSWENISEWFSKSPPPDSIVEGSEVSPYTERIRVRHGRWYQLGTPHSPVGTGRLTRVSGIRVGAGNTFREGLDWKVDLTRGRFYIIPGSPRALDNSLVDVTYFRRTAGTLIAETTSDLVLGSLRYIARNPYGVNTDYFFPLIRLSPQGANDLKGDEWQQVQFSADVLKRSPNTAMAYASRVGSPPMAVTADTTLISADTTLYTADNGALETE